MKLQLADLSHYPKIDEVRVHSIDWMIYQVSIKIESDEKLVYEGEQPFRCRNLLEIRTLFEKLNVGKYLLIRPDSAYDEMIGQPQPVFSDGLEMELYWAPLGTDHNESSVTVH